MRDRKDSTVIYADIKTTSNN